MTAGGDTTGAAEGEGARGAAPAAEPDRNSTGADVPGIGRWFPPARVRVRAGNLELRLPTDAEIGQVVAAVAEHGVHPVDQQPMASDWPLDEPELRGQRMFAWHSTNRANFAPGDWRWMPALFADGEPIGAQDVRAVDFATYRTAETGSWLLQHRQGEGLGTRMRAMALFLAFEGLGARYVTTAAWHDNAPSLGVSRKLGYEANGEHEIAIRGVPGRKLDFRMSAERWRERRPDLALGLEIEVAGVDDDVRAAFGAG